LAADYFQKLGFEIIARNHHEGHLEIDLIVRNSEQLIFVEVKSSSTAKFGHPAEWVDKRKRERLIRAAQSYLQKNDFTGLDLRFDVVTFVAGQMEHYPDAFGES
jgi:putative endonuclease